MSSPAVPQTEMGRFERAFADLITRGIFPSPRELLEQMGVKAERRCPYPGARPVGGCTLNGRLTPRRIELLRQHGFVKDGRTGRWLWPAEA
jgi:hypothetical protein